MQARKDEQMLKRRNICLEPETTPLSESSNIKQPEQSIPEIVEVGPPKKWTTVKHLACIFLTIENLQFRYSYSDGRSKSNQVCTQLYSNYYPCISFFFVS